MRFACADLLLLFQRGARVLRRGAGTMVCMQGGPTNQHNVMVKGPNRSKGPKRPIHRRSPYILKWRGHISPAPLCYIAP